MARRDCKHTNWSWQEHHHRDSKGPYVRRWKKCSDCGHTWGEQIVR